MGIDHGLDGRNNDKARIKRKRKAARCKSEILRKICTNERDLKGEVVFNEESRKEWLTGFQKRKTMRQQYGIAMQVFDNCLANVCLLLCRY